MKDYTIRVTEEIEKIAIEKGFEPIMASNPSYSPDKIPMLPTAEQICGWLREEKGIDVEITRVDWGHGRYYDTLYSVKLICKKVFDDENCAVGCCKEKTYKEAVLSGINFALDLID